MNQAINTPVRRAQKETLSADMPLGQKPDIVLPDVGPVNREQVITTLEEPLVDDYAAALKFAEEPVTVMIHPKQEANAPIVVDCWVNGRGAEVLMNGQWVVFNCLPVGKPVVTKRKYVEALLRSKIDTINTIHEDATVERPDNRVSRITSSNAVMSIIGDNNPKGAEWIRRLMAQPG